VAKAIERLSRYRDVAWFFAKYGRRDLFVSEPTPEEAEAFVRDLESLGPTFIKLGQLLSTRADLLPRAYLDALARLQDDVEPFPFDDVESIVQEELGLRLSKAFIEFDPVPIAAASLGQVHRAVLRSEREVAVKVQRPGIREQVLGDLETLDEIARLADRFTSHRTLDARRVLEEFRRSPLAELDYRQEAQHLITLSHQLRDFDTIVVPLPIDDYTTSRVLTMDFIHGTKITVVSGVERTEFDGRALADDLFRAYLQQILIDGVFHADPHPGNVFLTEDHRLALAPDFDVNDAIRRNATNLMRRRMMKAASPSSLFASVLDVKEFAERLPGRVNRILDSVAGNDLRLKVEIIDRGSIIDGFQKVANRIALGLVLAALIVGAAMLMRVQTSFTILGYPGFAMLLFIAAAGGGFWMAWTILAGDVRTRHH
jgi:predicted unusual protein kinase regulating ubiquinone biosynthesis (AarF/ABC1/UbiB family)